VPAKPVTLRQGTVTLADITVSIIDSSAFITERRQDTQQRSLNSVNFKKNLQKQKTLTGPMAFDSGKQDSWFINEEDRVCKGPDYLTKSEDLFKLLKQMKSMSEKPDCLIYETDADNFLTSIVFATTKMKECFLMYRDCLIVHTLPTTITSKLGLNCVVLYGVNSSGRNTIFGILFAADRKTFFTAFDQFFSYMSRKPSCVLMKRVPLSNPVYQGIRKFLKGSKATISFCPYSLHEELKDKFSFIRQDDQVLYRLLIGLPFIQDSGDLELHLKDLAKVRFNNIENLREYLKGLLVDKHMWSRASSQGFDVSVH
jgi:hypothetical protein